VKALVIAVLSVIFFGGFGILCIVWAAIALGRGEYLTAIVVLGFAGSCSGLVIPFIKVVPGRVTPRGTTDGAATMIRPDRGIDIPIQASLFCSVVAMGLFAIFWPLGRLDIPVPHSFRFSLPFMSAAGAVMGAPMLYGFLRRGGTKCLRLTPNGFEFGQGLSSSSGKWAQVKDITDRVPGQPTPSYSAIVVVMADGQTPTLAAGSYTPGGQALREMVRFYWQHPEHRAELTDGRALARLSSDGFKAE